MEKVAAILETCQTLLLDVPQLKPYVPPYKYLPGDAPPLSLAIVEHQRSPAPSAAVLPLFSVTFRRPDRLLESMLKLIDFFLPELRRNPRELCRHSRDFLRPCRTLYVGPLFRRAAPADASYLPADFRPPLHPR